MKNWFLFVGLLLVLGSGQFVEAKEPDVFFAQPVVVTATKYEVSTETIGNDVQIISNKDLETMGAKSIKDALSLVSGVVVVSGSSGTSIFSRGLASNQSKILFNGVELKDVMSPQGTPYLDALSIADVERIEIVQGAKSTLYGSEAMGGVINIISKKGLNTVDISHTGDSYIGVVNASASIGGTALQIGFNRTYDARLSALVNTTETDIQMIDNFRMFASRKFGKLESSFFYSKNIGLMDLDNDFDTVDDPNYQLDSEQDLFSITGKYAFFKTIDTTLKYSLSAISRATSNLPDMIDPLTSVTSAFSGRVETIELQNLSTLQPGMHFLFGLDTKTETGSSDYMSETPPLPYESHSNNTQSVNGYFAHFNYFNPILSFNSGVRLEQYASKQINTYSLSVFRDIPIVDMKIKLNLNTGFREPTLFERYDSFCGDPDLHSENSISREISFEKQINTIRFSVTYFDYLVNNRILYNEQTWKYNNSTSQTHSTGWQYVAKINTLAFLDFVTLDYSKINSTSGEAVSLRIPDEKLSIISGTSFGPFSAGLSVIHMGKRLDYGNIELSPYRIYNAKIQYQLEANHQLYLIVHNLLDNDYVEVSGYSVLGRALSLGYRYQF